VIFHIQDFSRLSVAVLLFAIWSARRVERANIQWAGAYVAMTVSDFALAQHSDSLAGPLIQMLAGVAAALLMWSGAELFRHKNPPRAALVIAAVIGVTALSPLALLHPEQMTQVLSLLLMLATIYASYRIWDYANVYRLTAVITVATAVLLFAYDALRPDQAGLRPVLAVGYVLLTLAIADVTIKQFQTRLLRVINTDSLTGLANRAAFVEALKSLLSATGRDPIHVAVICIDIENFRSVNEAIGYRNGNRVLCELGARLRHAAQRVYLVARDEGDRFMLLLSGTSDMAAMRNAEDATLAVHQAVSAPFRVGDDDVPIRIRVGADIAWGPDTDIEVLIQQAAVASGRQRNGSPAGLQFYSAQMNRVALRKLALDRGLREALTQGGLSLVYQPIVDVESGEFLMAEALLRWTSATLGPIEPAEMIPAAEESGLIIELGGWVVDQAVRQVAIWQDLGIAIPISVNVSAHQLRRPAFASQVLEVLKRHQVAPDKFEIELTESVFVGEDDAVVMGNVNALHAAGVRLSLDDFGTGFSSLSYLTRLPLSTIKIDKTFVHQLHRDERSKRLTETICAIGHQLDLQLTAEGVESAEQSLMLRSFGVRRMQGFFFAHPVPGHELTARLQMRPRKVSAA
jgi:diguanylate cyclase (GGDEF)-like protein